MHPVGAVLGTPFYSQHARLRKSMSGAGLVIKLDGIIIHFSGSYVAGQEGSVKCVQREAASAICPLLVLALMWYVSIR